MNGICEFFEEKTQSIKNKTQHNGKISISADKEKYITNSVVSEGIKVKITNHLNHSIYFRSGCADPALDIYQKFGNEKWTKSTKPSLCAEVPSVNELKSKHNITIGAVIDGSGKYKIGFSYYLKGTGKTLENQNELFSNSFVIESVEPTLDNSLKLCKERGDFTAGIDGVYYPYHLCIETVAVWIANKDANKAVNLCNETMNIISERLEDPNYKDYTCYRFIAEKIAKYNKSKAIEICNSIDDNPYGGSKDMCLKRIDRYNTCKTDSDCVVAIDTSDCCDCPSVYFKKQVDSDPALMEYEHGRDYSSFITADCSDIMCELCKPAYKAICHNGNCVDADFVKITYPNTSNFEFYPIHEINQNKFSSGTYNIKGYVVKIYTCPPCPKDAHCKMCMGNNIVISENNKMLETYTLTENELIIFVENPEQFELGKKYIFSIKIIHNNHIGLIGYGN